MFVCVCVYVCVCLHSIFWAAHAHLSHSGKRACVLPVSIIVPLQWAPVPQGAFLPQSIIQNVILLTALPLKSIGIHGGLHGRLVLKAPSCPAAAALQRLCGPAPLCYAANSKVCQSGNLRHVMGCGGLASADHSFTYLSSCSPLWLVLVFSLSWEEPVCCCEKAKERSFFFLISPLQTIPFPFLQS